MRRRTGFTLKELLVATAACLPLVLILLLMFFGSRFQRRLAYRAKCMANIRGIGQGIALYKAEYNDSYPFISNVEEMNYDAPMLAGGADDVFLLDGGKAGENHTDLNMAENLSLLKKVGVLPWKMFRCPEAGWEIMDRSAAGNSKYGFKDKDGNIYIDYAYHIGYFNTKDGLNAAPLLEKVSTIEAPLPKDQEFTLGEDFVILSDRPGANRAEFGTGGNDGTGYNHGDDGVCVLDAGGNTRFSKATLKAGWGENNIYTRDLPAHSDTPDGSLDIATPVNRHDSVLISPR